ncbi:hypothetical protein N7520_004760 [Penicillium odoratum]|uniref:uncharacterized protein n=1 Tax=Penicillium odoratum TaxID=1167516 RepID=UPI0025467122|nr:uncharacterized protein N7520_004760 [Penicillium odoratum]KAJ5765201.1 hypothetical protein N7520_004760 [Penicillium odoratum]
MKIFDDKNVYNYPFAAVSLAYFLRYPNRYSLHVLATDVIERFIDPNTNRLHSTRLHLKQTKVPSSILKLVPKGRNGPGHFTESYILETSIVDPTEGWMRTESRNLEWTGILSVVDRQYYQRLRASENAQAQNEIPLDLNSEQTVVYTNVTLHSSLGDGRFLSQRNYTDKEEETSKRGFFSALSPIGIQRAIELIGIKRTRDAVSKGAQGMNLVLERLRSGGIICVLEGIEQDRRAAF